MKKTTQEPSRSASEDIEAAGPATREDFTVERWQCTACGRIGTNMMPTRCGTCGGFVHLTNLETEKMVIIKDTAHVFIPKE